MGCMLTNAFGAPAALVSYLNWLGGQLDGKVHFRFTVLFVDRPLAGTIKGGLKSQYMILGTVSAYR